MDTGTTFKGSVSDLHSSIRDHYDGLLELYEELWGEHIHHGYWAHDEAKTDRHTAVERTIIELIRFAGLDRGIRLIDVGCGIGATSIFLAKQLEAEVLGVTISAPQIVRAREKASEAGMADSVSFENADAMRLPYPDASFDALWSLESCELMPDKGAFLRECMRVLRPGGKIVVATWCSRPGELSPREIKTLRRIYRDCAAAYVLPLDVYRSLCEDAGYEEIRTDDWTEYCEATWQLGAEIVKPFLRNPRFLWQLIRQKGLHTVRFLRSVPLMRDAFASGLMRYGVFTARKPLL